MTGYKTIRRALINATSIHERGTLKKRQVRGIQFTPYGAHFSRHAHVECPSHKWDTLLLMINQPRCVGSRSLSNRSP